MARAILHEWDLTLPDTEESGSESSEFKPEIVTYAKPWQTTGPMKLYIMGPMRGYTNLNFENFEAVATAVTRSGHTAVSPTSLDQVFGLHGSSHPDGEFNFDSYDWYASKRAWIARDFAAIMHEIDGVVALDGWVDSKGSLVEFALARFLDLTVYNEGGRVLWTPKWYDLEQASS